MTITPDETPRLANAAERNVYQALLEQLQANDRVVPGQRVTDHLKDHEVDFVVAIEGAGIVCLEVKGGDVWHDGDTWWQRRRGHEHRIDPVRQAREACYALSEFIEKDDRWTQGRLRWDHRSTRRCNGHRPVRSASIGSRRQDYLDIPSNAPEVNLSIVGKKGPVVCVVVKPLF